MPTFKRPVEALCWVPRYRPMDRTYTKTEGVPETIPAGAGIVYLDTVRLARTEKGLTEWRRLSPVSDDPQPEDEVRFCRTDQHGLTIREVIYSTTHDTWCVAFEPPEPEPAMPAPPTAVTPLEWPAQGQVFPDLPPGHRLPSRRLRASPDEIAAARRRAGLQQLPLPLDLPEAPRRWDLSR